MIKLLIVEDDESLSYIEKTSLEVMIGGYEVTTARNGQEGLEMWKQIQPDVIIADIDMPVMRGFEMVEKIRETDEDVIIIFTSALTSPNDVKSGFRLGVNNYIKKPFLPDELDAHIRALMKMKGGQKRRENSILHQIGIFTFDAAHATIVNTETKESKIMTDRESKLLQILAENKNEVVMREVILSRLWNTENDYLASRSLDVFVNKVRKILSADPSVTIKTLRRVGLMLVVK